MCASVIPRLSVTDQISTVKYLKVFFCFFLNNIKPQLIISYYQKLKNYKQVIENSHKYSQKCANTFPLLDEQQKIYNTLQQNVFLTTYFTKLWYKL